VDDEIPPALRAEYLAGASQQLDLEIIKRKYANMIDILTYDDLLRRLDNIIASLHSRAAAQDSGEVDVDEAT